MPTDQAIICKFSCREREKERRGKYLSQQISPVFSTIYKPFVCLTINGRIQGCKRAGITGYAKFTALKLLFSLSLSLRFFFALLPVLFTCLFYSPPSSPLHSLFHYFSLSLSLSLFLRFVFTRFVLMTKIARETRGAYYLTGRLKK